MFKPPKKELELVFSELFESKKTLFLEVMKKTYDEKHNFLFLNIPTQRLFKNWNQLIILDEDDDEDEIQKLET